MLNIVNEYDFVALADRPYIHSVIDLYRSDAPVVSNPQNWPIWQLPGPEFRHLGPVVVLKIIPSADDSEEDIVAALQVTSEELSRLLFCRLSVHHRETYLDRIQHLEKGCFNGQSEWPSTQRAP